MSHTFAPRRIAAITVLIMCGLFLPALYAQDATPAPDLTPTPPHWTYEGEEGPESWGELDPSFALCAEGEAQSPINIADAQPVNLVDLEFSYQPSAMNIFNNGHTIQVAYDAGSSVIYNETEYQLLQFHFHTPSEHQLNGESAGMEVHFVHRDANGSLLVVGVMLVEGDENPAYASLFDNLPAEKGDPQPTELSIDAAAMLPQNRQFYTYTGSLTTPPCSQGVRWIVMTTPVQLSSEQIEAFHSIFEMNARPVQPLNQRDLLEDSSAG